MLNCREAARLITQGLDRDLTRWERVALRIHLFFCHACTNFRSHMAFLRSATKRFRHGEVSDGD